MLQDAIHPYSHQLFRPGPGDCVPSLEPPQVKSPRRARSADCSTRLGRTPTCTEAHHGPHQECAWKRGEGRCLEGKRASDGSDPRGGRRCRRDRRKTREPPSSEGKSCPGLSGLAVGSPPKLLEAPLARGSQDSPLTRRGLLMEATVRRRASRGSPQARESTEEDSGSEGCVGSGGSGQGRRGSSRGAREGSGATASGSRARQAVWRKAHENSRSRRGQTGPESSEEFHGSRVAHPA